jgi:cyclophilin family peptidyl-prolyl cis-trans isomerase
MATALLQQIVLGTIDPKEYPSAVKNLLTYCEQDTWAMVRIWEVVKEEIG